MSMNATIGTLYHEAERLDNPSLDAFIAQITLLRVRRDFSDRQKQEADLLKKINKSLSVPQIEQFRLLKDKLANDNMTEQEHTELLLLLEKVENLNVSRLKHLTNLARLRHISVRELMAQLGISNASNG